MYYRLKTDRGCVLEVIGDVAYIRERTHTWNKIEIHDEIPEKHIMYKNFIPDYFRTYLKQVELL